MKKNLIKRTLVVMMPIITECKKMSMRAPKKYSADVAAEWMKLHMKLSRTTPGFNSVVTNRSFAYAGLVLYESIVPGLIAAPNYRN